MFVRVVRFADVSVDRMNEMAERIDQEEGPPVGVPSTGLQVLVDEDQKTAVVLQHFATREDMEAGAQVLSAMDPSDTPGSRVSVDACEVKLEVSG